MIPAPARSEARVAVRKLGARYLLPRNHPSTASASGRLDRIVQNAIRPACARSFAGQVDPADTSVWFVRKLDVRVAVSLGANDTDIADAWAAQIGRALGTTLRAGSDGASVVRFRDRADYLASFADAAAAGRASEWVYRSLRRTGARSSGAEIAASLTAHPEQAPAVIAELAATGRLGRVLAALTEADAREIVDAYERGTAAEPTSPVRELFRACAEAWPAVAGTYAGSARTTLHLLGALSGSSEAASGANAPAFATAFVALADALHAADDPRAVVADLAAGRPVEAAATVKAPEVLAFAAQMLKVDREGVLAFAGTLAPTERAPAPPSRHDTLESPYGGAFLLLPALADLAVEHLFPELTPAAARLEVLVRALAGTADDHALHLAAGGPRPDAETPPKVDADAFCERLTRRLVDLRHAAGSPLVRSHVQLSDGTPVAILRDLERDAWLHVTRPERAGGAVVAVAAAIEQEPDLYHEDAAVPPGPAWTRRARPPEADLTTLFEPFDEDSVVFALAARALARAFGHRMLGLGWSSVTHLRENLLSSRASVRLEPAMVRVELDPPPLRVLLDLAGVTREPFEVPWLDRPVSIVLAE